jgi:hypothetical protein
VSGRADEKLGRLGSADYSTVVARSCGASRMRSGVIARHCGPVGFSVLSSEVRGSLLATGEPGPGVERWSIGSGRLL